MHCLCPCFICYKISPPIATSLQHFWQPVALATSLSDQQISICLSIIAILIFYPLHLGYLRVVSLDHSYLLYGTTLF